MGSHIVRTTKNKHDLAHDLAEELSSKPIDGPPIPEDLFWLYKLGMTGDAAVCTWSDVGARNSRWVNVNEKLPHTLINLLERIARLEDGLQQINELVENEIPIRRGQGMMDAGMKRFTMSLVEAANKTLEDAKMFRQEYKLDANRPKAHLRQQPNGQNAGDVPDPEYDR